MTTAPEMQPLTPQLATTSPVRAPIRISIVEDDSEVRDGIAYAWKYPD